MTTRLWLSMVILPLTMAAVAPASSAQGKGKGQSQEQGQGKGQGGKKSDKAQPPQPASRRADKDKQAGRNEKAATPRVGDNRGLGNARGRSSEKMDRNSPPAVVPVSPNASARAREATASNPGRAVGRFARDLHFNEVRPVAVRTYIASNRPSQFVTAGAISYALARGIPDNSLVIVPTGNDIWVRNKRGEALLAIDDDRARNLGVWQVSPLVNPVKEGSPSFCRSGAGHPVWGRQWCLQKGFGLGESRDVEWAAARDIGNLVYVRPVTTGNLTRDALLNLLGPVAFDRLALHALTLGYTDPLTGRWQSDATGPSVLLVNSGRYPVAELVDGNRDQRPDLMLVALRPW